MKRDKNRSKYENALKHVTELKEFYQHLFVYIIFVLLWLIFKENIVEFVVAKTKDVDSGFLHWLRINLTLVPVIWGIGILIHGLYLHKFKLSIFKKWEDKKIKEFMNEDSSTTEH